MDTELLAHNLTTEAIADLGTVQFRGELIKRIVELLPQIIEKLSSQLLTDDVKRKVKAAIITAVSVFAAKYMIPAAMVSFLLDDVLDALLGLPLSN